MKKIKLTTKGHKKVQDELSELKTNQQQKAISRLQKARAMGDLSENSEYTAAKESLAFIENRIAELQAVLDHSEIIEEVARDTITVEIGNTVVLTAQKETHTYSIVGEFEADPANKKLSNTSPLGKALLGRKRGEVIHVEVPVGVIEYTIVDIK